MLITFTGYLQALSILRYAKMRRSVERLYITLFFTSMFTDASSMGFNNGVQTVTSLAKWFRGNVLVDNGLHC
jgi:hypothetical protein